MKLPLILLIFPFIGFGQNEKKITTSVYELNKSKLEEGFVKEFEEIYNEESSTIYELSKMENDTLIETGYNNDFEIKSITKYVFTNEGLKVIKNTIEYPQIGLLESSEISGLYPNSLSVENDTLKYNEIIRLADGKQIHINEFRKFDRIENVSVLKSLKSCIKYRNQYLLKFKDINGNTLFTDESKLFEFRAQGLGIVLIKMDSDSINYVKELKSTYSIKEFQNLLNNHKEKHNIYKVLTDSIFANNNCLNLNEGLQNLNNDYFNISYPTEWEIDNDLPLGLDISSRNFEDSLSRGFLLSVVPYKSYYMKKNSQIEYYNYQDAFYNGQKAILLTRNDLLPNDKNNTVYWRKEIRIHNSNNDYVYYIICSKRAQLNKEPDWCEFNKIIESFELK